MEDRQRRRAEEQRQRAQEWQAKLKAYTEAMRSATAIIHDATERAAEERASVDDANALARQKFTRDVLVLELIEAKRRMYGNPTLYREQEEEILARNIGQLDPSPVGRIINPFSLFGGQ